MNSTTSKVGRPSLSTDQVDSIFRKLEPYLKCGLSFNKACLQAQVPKSTAYDLYSASQVFAEKIDQAKIYHAILVTDIITRELEGVKERQKFGKGLRAEEIRLVQWLALNSRSLQEEYRGENEKSDKSQEMDIALEALRNMIDGLSGPENL